MDMETRIAELRYKEVISMEDGSRFGYVGDLEIDLERGQVTALVVPGRRRLFGLLLFRLLLFGRISAHLQRNHRGH